MDLWRAAPLNRRLFLVLGASLTCAACGGTRTQISGVHIWGERGARDGAFVKPRAIGINGDEIYVIDTTGRIQVFDLDGEYQRGWSAPSGEKGTPTCVTFLRNGRVLIPDTHYSQILEYTPQGELLEKWGTYGTGPDEFIYPTGVAEGPDETLYICEYGEGAHRIRAFRGRKAIKAWSEFGTEPGQLNRAMAIVLDSKGYLHVADTGNNRVQTFTTDGELVRVIGGPGNSPGMLKDPFAIALGPDDSLYVCEYGNYRISQFTRTGQYIRSFGEPGRGLGQFGEARGVAVDRFGRVFVADTSNDRIQRIELRAAG